jgi:hypothetical protein
MTTTNAKAAYEDAIDILTFADALLLTFADALRARSPRGIPEVDATMFEATVKLYELAVEAVQNPSTSFDTYLQATALYHSVCKVYRDAH